MKNRPILTTIFSSILAAIIVAGLVTFFRYSFFDFSTKAELIAGRKAEAYVASAISFVMWLFILNLIVDIYDMAHDQVTKARSKFIMFWAAAIVVARVAAGLLARSDAVNKSLSDSEITQVLIHESILTLLVVLGIAYLGRILLNESSYDTAADYPAAKSSK